MFYVTFTIIAVEDRSVYTFKKLWDRISNKIKIFYTDH